MSSDHAPQMECPECGEDAVNQPTTDRVPWGAHGLERPEWSHRDGSSLCPVIGPSGGYEPAQPLERAQEREAGENPYKPFTPEHRVWTIARSSPGMDGADVLTHAGWVPHDGTAMRKDLLAQYRRESAAELPEGWRLAGERPEATDGDGGRSYTAAQAHQAARRSPDMAKVPQQREPLGSGPRNLWADPEAC